MTVRARLEAKGLLDAAGNVTPAGDAWTDEQIRILRRQTLQGRIRGEGAAAVP